MASSERQLRGQTDYNPVNERQQRRLTDHLPSNEREQRGLTEIPSSERQQRCQRDQIPSNETEQRDQELTFLQVKGSKGDKESKLLQMKGNKGVKEIKSLQTWDITVHVKQLVLDAEVEGLTYEYTVEGKGYDDDTDINTLYDNCPDDDVDYDQWVSLVNFWRSEEGKRRSNRSKESLEKAKVKPIHTTGTKSHARVREDSIGKDKYGRVCGLGLGVKPSDVGDPSYPRFCNGLNMSTDNEAAVITLFSPLGGGRATIENSC
ncbi:GTP-binding protein TypA/BipA-like protein [Bienertia sinuspersici]